MKKSLNQRTADRLLEIKNLPEYDYSLSSIRKMLKETLEEHNKLVKNGEPGTTITEKIGLYYKNLNSTLIELGKEECYFPFCKIFIDEMTILKDWFTDQDSIATEIELVLKDDENNRMKATFYVYYLNRDSKRFYRKDLKLIDLNTNEPFDLQPQRVSSKFFEFFSVCEYYLTVQFPNHFGDEILEAYFNYLLPAAVLKNTFAENR